MKYLCLVYLEEEKLRVVPDRECQACDDDLRKGGILVAAEALQPVATATTLRVRNGRAAVTDGPFAETKEQLLGFYVVDCATQEEALEAARQIGTACTSRALEVRPISWYQLSDSIVHVQ